MTVSMVLDEVTLPIHLLIFLDKITRVVDDGEDLDIIYLDFAKAFDIVSH